jgi:hypothetical protein
LRLLLRRLPETLCAFKQEVFFMKTSNLVAFMIALLVSFGGFEAINFLFTHVAAAHEQASTGLVLEA